MPRADNNSSSSLQSQLLESEKQNDCRKIKNILQKFPNLAKFSDEVNPQTILYKVCLEEKVKTTTIEELIENGASPVGIWGSYPIHAAVLNENVDILKIIIQKLGAHEINQTFEFDNALLTLIKFIKPADKDKFVNHVKVLLQGGINVNFADSYNLTAIGCATEREYREIKEAIQTSLQNLGLDEHKHDDKSARDLIREGGCYDGQLPSKRTLEGKAQLFSYLKQRRNDDFKVQFGNLSQSLPGLVDAEDEGGTLLQYASHQGNEDLVEFLMENQADVVKKSRFNPTDPIDYALKFGFPKVLSKLLADPRTKISEKYFAVIVRNQDNPDYVETLQTVLQHPKIAGLDVNKADALGYPPLHYALLYASDENCLRLLSAGASLAFKNDDNYSPIIHISESLLKAHLENCIQIKFDKEKSKFAVTFQYKSLLSSNQINVDGTNSGKNSSETEKQSLTNDSDIQSSKAILEISRSSSLCHLLAHPVILYYIYKKQTALRRCVNMNFTFYCLLTVLLLLSVCFRHPATTTLAIVFLSLLALKTLTKILVFQRRYIRNFDNYLEVVLLFTAALFCCSNNNVLAAVLVLLLAFNFIFLLGESHQFFSTYVAMFRAVILSFLKLFSFVFIFLLLAFSASFFLVFEASGTVPKFFQTVFNMSVMITGEFNRDSFPYDTYSPWSYFLFLFFVIVMNIIVLNVVNALAISDIQAIQANAELESLAQKVRSIYNYESIKIYLYKYSPFKSLNHWVFGKFSENMDNPTEEIDYKNVYLNYKSKRIFSFVRKDDDQNKINEILSNVIKDRKKKWQYP